MTNDSISSAQIQFDGEAKMVAEGSADIYPRFGTTMEWDTAAGDAVLRAAGGAVTTFDGKALVYGKPGFANPYFLARGDVNPSLLLK